MCKLKSDFLSCCHMSHITCHMSHVTCHICQMLMLILGTKSVCVCVCDCVCHAVICQMINVDPGKFDDISHTEMSWENVSHGKKDTWGHLGRK